MAAASGVFGACRWRGAIEEVRKTRERLAKEFNFDVDAIFEDWRKRQAEWGTRLVRRERKTEGERTPTPER